MENKFRVWNKNKKIICPVKEINFIDKEITIKTGDEKEKEIIARGGHRCHNCDPEWDDILYFKEVEIMQFTGLCDKNGKKIYEGDILKQGSEIGAEIDFVRYEKIELNDEKHQWANTIGFHAGIIDFEVAEVIGNIWENKELLNERN